MDDKAFVWTSELTKRFIHLRFDNDWIFKEKKQPWRLFFQLLLDNGFPEEITISHVRKKWSYTYDMYKIAKKEKNKAWKYYKIFDKHYGKTQVLDKYESWPNEWRLKLISAIAETKELKLDVQNMWRHVEKSLRSQDLPHDCCIQDVKGLWHHLRMTFNRKFRVKRNKAQKVLGRKRPPAPEWPPYDAMKDYFKKHEPDYMKTLESEVVGAICRKSSFFKHAKLEIEDSNTNEFQWSKDITETFIQLRLQNDWLFKERRSVWKEFRVILIKEYGFPKTMTSRDICRKWAATMREYQKAKATNNSAWVYYNLFELYLGESRLSINPLVDWQEEWVLNLISARTSIDHLFKCYEKDPSIGWREVEKRLRLTGLPLDHSLLELNEMWEHLLKTYRWKKKFEKKGILTEHWPFLEAMAHYYLVEEKKPAPAPAPPKRTETDASFYHDDDYEDDMKLFDLKQQMQMQLKPKDELDQMSQCRACANNDATINIFDERDDDGVDVASKLRIIAGVQVEPADSLSFQICYNCHHELEIAYKFRRRCQHVDKQLRDDAVLRVKLEGDNKQDFNPLERPDDGDVSDAGSDAGREDAPVVKREKTLRKKYKRYNYWKICEVCGVNTKSLKSHMDTHNQVPRYSCEVCDKKFKFKSGLIIHRAVHDPTPRKTCEICGKTFHILAQYRRHFVYHANERKFECDTCGKRFNTSEILKVHSRTHTDERPFQCPHCGKTFRTAGCVSRHTRIVHKHVRKIQ